MSEFPIFYATDCRLDKRDTEVIQISALASGFGTNAGPLQVVLGLALPMRAAKVLTRLLMQTTGEGTTNTESSSDGTSDVGASATAEPDHSAAEEHQIAGPRRPA